MRQGAGGKVWKEGITNLTRREITWLAKRRKAPWEPVPVGGTKAPSGRAVRKRSARGRGITFLYHYRPRGSARQPMVTLSLLRMSTARLDKRVR